MWNLVAVPARWWAWGLGVFVENGTRQENNIIVFLDKIEHLSKAVKFAPTDPRELLRLPAVELFFFLSQRHLTVSFQSDI